KTQIVPGKNGKLLNTFGIDSGSHSGLRGINHAGLLGHSNLLGYRRRRELHRYIGNRAECNGDVGILVPGESFARHYEAIATGWQVSNLKPPVLVGLLASSLAGAEVVHLHFGVRDHSPSSIHNGSQ